MALTQIWSSLVTEKGKGTMYMQWSLTVSRCHTVDYKLELS